MHWRNTIAAIFVSAFLAACQTTTGENESAEVGRAFIKSSFVTNNIGRLKAPHGHRVTDERVRRGNRSDRFEMRHNDCAYVNNKELDCIEDRQRVEREEDPRGRFQKVGTSAWYGFSLYVPSDFPQLAPVSVNVLQAKIPGFNPLWELNLHGPAMIYLYGDIRRPECRVASLNSLRGRWTDFVIFADYSARPSMPSFRLWMNGELKCQMSFNFYRSEFGAAGNRLHMRHGIYQAYISRWLKNNATKPVNVSRFNDPNSSSSSWTGTPFAYDWGVELPTQIIYFDEFRIGTTREQVDVRIHEAAGVRPVD